MQYLKSKKLFLSITISICLLCFSIESVAAQNYSPVKSIVATNDSKIETDYLGNLYIISEFRISKYDINGKPLYVFEDYKNGAIASIDVTDPMKILVFYSDFMVVKALDVTLSEMASYALNEVGYYSISALAHSRDDDFWIFDNTSFVLKKIQETGKALYQSERFNLLFQETVQVRQIIDYENHVYVNDPTNGIYVFDRFGTYQKKIPIIGADKIQIIQGIIVYFENGKLKSYNTQEIREEEMSLPDWLTPEYAQIQKDRVYIKEKDRVSIYTFK